MSLSKSHATYTEDGLADMREDNSVFQYIIQGSDFAEVEVSLWARILPHEHETSFFWSEQYSAGPATKKRRQGLVYGSTATLKPYVHTIRTKREKNENKN